jgi:hypothetical protein
MELCDDAHLDVVREERVVDALSVHRRQGMHGGKRRVAALRHDSLRGDRQVAEEG